MLAADFYTVTVNWLTGHWQNILLYCAILLISWLCYRGLLRFLRVRLKKSRLEPNAVSFLSSVCLYGLRGCLALVWLYPFGVTFSGIIAALAAAGVGLAIGLTEPISNFFSGILLVCTKPFSVGDFVMINQVEGTVSELRMMHTALITSAQQEIIIPNKTVSGGMIVNYTVLGVRRATIDFTARQGENLNDVRRVALELCNDHPLILRDPAPSFHVQGFTCNGQRCTLRFYTTADDYWNALWEMNEQLTGALPQHGIPIAFHQIEVHGAPEQKPKRSH